MPPRKRKGDDAKVDAAVDLARGGRAGGDDVKSLGEGSLETLQTLETVDTKESRETHSHRSCLEIRWQSIYINDSMCGRLHHVSKGLRGCALRAAVRYSVHTVIGPARGPAPQLPAHRAAEPSGRLGPAKL